MLLFVVLIGSILQITSVKARKPRHHRNHNAAVEVSSTQVEMAILNVLGSPLLSTSTSQADSFASDAPVDLVAITPAPALTSSTSACVPSSICFDGFTCSQRYGGCYDQNYCDGNTSPYPIPTCNSSPSLGLSANNVNKAIDRIAEDSGSSVAQEVAEDLVAAQMEHGQLFKPN